MELDRKIRPVYHYPIDDYPIDIHEFIKAYEAGLDEIKDDNACAMLFVGSILYKNEIRKNSTFCEDPDFYKFSIDLFAYTGYIPDRYFPNEAVLNKLMEAPEIAVTDLDKALLGMLISTARCLSFGINQDGKNNRDEFYSYIYFLYNAQRYEQRTKRTIAIPSEINDSYVFNILTDPTFSEIESDAIVLSDPDVEHLSSILLYREELRKLIEEARAYEKEYVINEQNNSDWELFISCVNYRASEEQRVTNLINSDIPVSQKLYEFKTYFEKIDEIPDMFNSSMSLRDLTDRIIKRTELAPNYVWVRVGDDLVYLDNTIISSVCSPYSFNCVLIAYHAFLIEMSTENITRLVFSLNMFIGKNLGREFAKHKKIVSQSSIEQDLISICDTILKFYEKHKADIASIKYDNIQNEETLSGFSFDGDIYRRVLEKERKMAVDNVKAFADMDDEWEDFLDGLYDLFEDVASDDDINDDLYDDIYSLEKDLASHLPNVFDDEKKLIEREIGNRLIVSINAIYILVKVMDRLLDKGLIREEYKYDIINSSKLLSKLEKHLVRTTYIAPSFNCFDDIDMDDYRERKCIDASIIELQNNERIEMTLFDSARRSIRALHNEIQDINYENVSEIKSKLRDEIKDLPDSQLKDFVVELIDQECQHLCNSLIEANSSATDFETIKKQVCDYIGSSCCRLPEGTINALTTAELLFSQYAGSEKIPTDFDFSGISALYYQAVETMYNELVWTEYANFLNNLGDFKTLYSNKEKLPTKFQGYLPKGNYSDNGSIVSFLMLGSFNYILYNATSFSHNDLHGFRVHLDRTFGYSANDKDTSEYALYQKRIDDLYKYLKKAHPRRNNASHGYQPISLKECKDDKRLVLSDVEGVRKGALGIIMLFLSLYKE